MTRSPHPRWILAVALVGAVSPALAGGATNPLEPQDHSSPRATLRSFLESGDAFFRALEHGYVRNPSRAGYHRLVDLVEPMIACMDLSHVAPVARLKGGRAAAFALFETLDRIPLPPLQDVPDAAQMAARKDGADRRWVLPGTEIAIVRVDRGAAGSEFVFSADTVARAIEFAHRTEALPSLRKSMAPELHGMVMYSGGWMVPISWVLALPPVFRVPLWDQALWKWVALLLLVLLVVPVTGLALRLSRLGEGRGPFARALAGFAVPLALLALVPIVTWVALAQVNLVGDVGSAVEVGAFAVFFLVGAWVAWRLAPVLAEAAIASPRIATESLDAHLIRLSARLLGILGALTLLAVGADRLGIPVYGIVAGLGVGGLAVALATQPTLENLIAGLNLFADRPLRVGDSCKVGDATGTVEGIGIRSTRIRGADRTLTTIPNGALARMPIQNQSARDRTLLEATLGLRYETTPVQLKAILASIETLLAAHPRVVQKGARVRFVAFGPSSLDVQVRAYVDTVDAGEFQSIRQEIFLRLMELVEEGGSAFAFPSTTLYLGKDRPPGPPRGGA